MDFSQHERNRAEEKYAQMIAGAEIDNACYDHARELAASLRKYFAGSHTDVNLAVEENRVMLTYRDRCLVISTKDHRRYEVMGVSPIMDARRKRFATYISERQMMDEILGWLAKP
jgi:hypothetical protein